MEKYRTKMHEEYVLLRNTQSFEKKLKRPKVTKLRVPSTPQNSKALWSKGTWAIVRDSMKSGWKGNLLSKNGSRKGKVFPCKYCRRYTF